jgi:hypothetical protein
MSIRHCLFAALYDRMNAAAERRWMGKRLVAALPIRGEAVATLTDSLPNALKRNDKPAQPCSGYIQ